MLKVELLSYTPEPEKIIASSAKLCYSSASIDEIRDNLNEENKVSLFVRYIEIETGKYETRIVNKNQ